jgi:hypothetical protein
MATVGLVSLPAAPAGAAGVGCGDTITASVVLDADLACTGPALVVGADGVTLDLGGHSLSSSTATALAVTGHTGVTVRNGTIRNSRLGALVDGSPDTRLLKLSFVGNGAGTTAIGTGAMLVAHGGATIRQSRFAANGLAVTGDTNPRPIVVTDSVFTQNVGAFGLLSNTGSTLLRNVFRGNGSAVSVTEGLAQDVEFNLFTGNDTNYSGFIAGDQTFVGNAFHGGAFGISLRGPSSGNNRIEYNSFAGSTVGVQLGAGRAADEVFGTVVRRNVFLDNGAAGLLYDVSLSRPGPASTIAENLFAQNGFRPQGTTSGAGLPVSAGLWVSVGPGTPAVVVEDNSALGNAGYGIEAYGATDGGGNIARRNGNPAQCLGVACR